MITSINSANNWWAQYTTLFVTIFWWTSLRIYSIPSPRYMPAMDDLESLLGTLMCIFI
jgi:hypothetical protein